jgi:small conductance mechanosensitive channel
MPNAQIYGGTIVNYSAQDTRRIDLVVGIGYSDDIKKARDILVDILASEERVLKDPGATVMLLELGASSVDFAVRPWVNTADYWAVRADLLEAVKNRFDKEGISIPFPQQDVHMYEAKKA